MHLAADFGQKEVMEYLISAGANINVRAAAVTSPPHTTNER